MFVEKNRDSNGILTGQTIHIVGRTHNIPSHFFYRRWVLSATVNRWTPWERVPLDGVKIDHILPFVMRGDVYIVWPEITQFPTDTNAGDPKTAGPKWRLQMAWTRKTAQGWSDRFLSQDTIEHPWVYGKNENQTFAFRVRKIRFESDPTTIDCYGALRDGSLSYIRHSTDEISAYRTFIPVPNKAPFWVQVQVTGLVYALYQNGLVSHLITGAQVKLSVVLTGGSPDDKYWGPKNRQWDIEHDLAGYENKDTDTGSTNMDGSFTLNLALVTQIEGYGFYREQYLNCIPTFVLTVTIPNAPPQSKSFFYFDPTSNSKYYSDERFQQNFVFNLAGTPPDGESDRPVAMKQISIFSLMDAEDAVILPQPGDPPLQGADLKVPDGMLTYGSGYRAINAIQTSALAVPNSMNVSLWNGVAPKYFLLPSFPADSESPEVLVYSASDNNYFIRKEAVQLDPDSPQNNYQILLSDHPRVSHLRRVLVLLW